MRVIVTGGAGFIGSAVVRMLVREADTAVCTVDKLTYAGNRASLRDVDGLAHHRFEQADIADRGAIHRGALHEGDHF